MERDDRGARKRAGLNGRRISKVHDIGSKLTSDLGQGAIVPEVTIHRSFAKRNGMDMES